MNEKLRIFFGRGLGQIWVINHPIYSDNWRRFEPGTSVREMYLLRWPAVWQNFFFWGGGGLELGQIWLINHSIYSDKLNGFEPGTSVTVPAALTRCLVVGLWHHFERTEENYMDKDSTPGRCILISAFVSEYFPPPPPGPLPNYRLLFLRFLSVTKLCFRRVCFPETSDLFYISTEFSYRLYFYPVQFFSSRRAQLPGWNVLFQFGSYIFFQFFQ